MSNESRKPFTKADIQSAIESMEKQNVKMTESEFLDRMQAARDSFYGKPESWDEFEKRVSLSLANGKGHATFPSMPSKETLEAVNTMADLAFTQFSRAKPGQIKIIHTLLSKIGKANDKEYKIGMVKTFSNDRETSTKKLFYKEANELIEALQKLVGASPEEISNDVMRKKILHLAHKMEWTLDNGKVDFKAVNTWCINKGKYHKPLNDHNHVELTNLVTQFLNVYKSHLKAIKK